MWQPSAEKRTSRASAQREFKGLIALLPLEVQVPVQALFTVDLPPGGKLPPGHRPVSMQATIAGMKDEVVIMQSLMKPKKITFVGRYVSRACTKCWDHQQSLHARQHQLQHPIAEHS